MAQACAPTNFHYLTLDVTPNLDGVVEHPYTFSMPPETVPFGWGFEKRDGIRIGDREHTFAGLVRSYKEHFKKTGRDRQLWVTEFGFTSFWFNGKVEGRQYAGFSEQAQAEYLIRRFIESLALPIEVTCQYDFIDDYDSQESGEEANFGLLRSDFSRHALLKRPELGHERLLDGLFGGQAGGAGRPLLPEFGDFGRNHELACGDQPVEFEMKRGRLVDFRLAGTAARFSFGGGIVRGLDRSSKPFVQNLRIFGGDFGQIVPCSFQRSEFRRIILHRRGRQLFEFAAYLFAPVQMLAEFA